MFSNVSVDVSLTEEKYQIVYSETTFGLARSHICNSIRVRLSALRPSLSHSLFQYFAPCYVHSIAESRFPGRDTHICFDSRIEWYYLYIRCIDAILVVLATFYESKYKKTKKNILDKQTIHMYKQNIDCLFSLQLLGNIDRT